MSHVPQELLPTSSPALDHLHTSLLIFADVKLEVHEVLGGDMCRRHWRVAASAIVCRVEVGAVEVWLVQLLVHFVMNGT